MKQLIWRLQFEAKKRNPSPLRVEGVERAPFSPSLMEQIRSDLKGLPRGDMATFFSEKEIAKEFKLLLFTLSKNRVFVETHSEKSNPRTTSLLQSIQELARSTPLPDMQFLVSLHDSVDLEKLEVPLFTFAKNRGSMAILFPDFEALSGRPKILAAVEEGNEQHLFDQLEEKALWRGAMTAPDDQSLDGARFTVENFLEAPRSRAITQSLSRPDLIDARYSICCQTDEPKKIQKKFKKYFAPFLPISEHLRYKYHLLIDGNSCAYARAHWALLSNGAVFKQESDAIQWYYGGLKEWVHYIPLRKDLSDLVEKIEWAQENNERVREIALEGQKFAIEFLSRPRVFQYTAHLLRAYSEMTILS